MQSLHEPLQTLYAVISQVRQTTPLSAFFPSRKNHLSRLMTKPSKWHVRPEKTRISLGIRPVWSESLLSAWRKLGPLAIHWVCSEDWSDCADAPAYLSLAGRTATLLVLSRGGPLILFCFQVAELYEDTLDRLKAVMQLHRWYCHRCVLLYDIIKTIPSQNFVLFSYN